MLPMWWIELLDFHINNGIDYEYKQDNVGCRYKTF